MREGGEAECKNVIVHPQSSIAVRFGNHLEATSFVVVSYVSIECCLRVQVGRGHKLVQAMALYAQSV
jgi:hypothetical protein